MLLLKTKNYRILNASLFFESYVILKNHGENKVKKCTLIYIHI